MERRLYLYHSGEPYFFHPILRIYRGHSEPFAPVSAYLVLRSWLARSGTVKECMTNIQYCIYDGIYTVAFRGCNCAYKFGLSPPTSSNGTFLVKLAEIPLKVVRT